MFCVGDRCLLSDWRLWEEQSKLKGEPRSSPNYVSTNYRQLAKSNPQLIFKKAMNRKLFFYFQMSITEAQSIPIIHRVCICKFVYLPKHICNSESVLKALDQSSHMCTHTEQQKIWVNLINTFPAELKQDHNLPSWISSSYIVNKCFLICLLSATFFRFLCILCVCVWFCHLKWAPNYC